jgi:tetratricopeptide (TPR) repeat protein
VRVLCVYGLVEPNKSLPESQAESGGYGMHGCVHSWTIHVLNKVKDRKPSRLAMRCVAAHVPEKTDLESWVVQRRLLRHADRCRALVFDEVPLAEGDEWVEYGKILNCLGHLFSFHDRFRDAETACLRALEGCGKTLGQEHPSTLATVSHLGDIYADQGRVAAAEDMYHRALQGYRQTHGHDHMLTVDVLHALGSLYADEGRLSEAEVIFQRVLATREAMLGSDNLRTLHTAHGLGNLYVRQGRLSKAKAILQRTLEGKERTLGHAHTSTLHTVNGLGNVYADEGQLDKAEAMYRRALEGYKKALGHEQVDNYLPALYTMGNLAGLYIKQGKIPEARALLVRCQAGLGVVFGARHDMYGSVYKCGSGLGDDRLRSTKWSLAYSLSTVPLQAPWAASYP